jgi:hypothetical protein
MEVFFPSLRRQRLVLYSDPKDVFSSYLLVGHFFLFKMIFPTCLFVLLTWIVFWIKVEDLSTSLAVVITLMLTVVAFGIAIDSMIPRLGYRTWFDLFQACCFVSIFITGLECIVVYTVARRCSEGVAEKLRRLSRIVLPAFFLVAALVLVGLR